VPAQPVDQPADEPAAETPVRVTFRIPRIGLLVVLAVIMCAIPAAFTLPGMQAILLIPLAGAVWLVRNRTVADADKLDARHTFSRQVLPWSEVASLRLRERSWVRAVRTDDSEVTLPAVRLRHLPMLAKVSGGRISDPNAKTTGRTEPPTEPIQAQNPAGESDQNRH
jgi:hypothetical protein